ncbi:MAG: MDR family MFS transporter [Variovorax sp.]
MNDCDAPTHPGRRRWILAALMMTMMLAAMDVTIVSTAIPQIVGDLGGFALFSWVFSIYLLAQTVTIPIYGKLADTFGRKPILVIGTLIFLVGSVASALAWNMVGLIACRALQGLGAGSIMATVNTLAGDLYSVRERGRIQGWLSSVWGVAAIAGPTLGGAFAQYASWRWIFLINLPIGALALMLIVRFVHEPPLKPRRHRIDYAGAALIALAASALMFGLLQGGHAWPWLSAPSIGMFVLALVLIAVLVMVERRAAEPIQPRWLWRKRALVASNLSMLGMGVVLMGPSIYLPTFGQSVYGLGAIAAGFVLASMSIGWPLASSFSGRLYLRIGFRDTALCGALLLVAGAIGFLLISVNSPIGWVVLDQVLLGAGFGLLSTPLLVGVQSTVTWHDRGVVTGANIFSRYLGQSLGAALFGTIFNGSLAESLAAAPAALRAALPSDIGAAIGNLHQQALPAAADDYLRLALYTATHHVYEGLTVVALLTLMLVLFTPRHFSPANESSPVGAADLRG